MDKTKRLVQWLKDAHAMELQAEAMLSGMAQRVRGFPELRERIVQHLEETRRQAEMVARCLERHGAKPSGVKDAAGRTTGAMQAFSGVLFGDEVVKGAMAGYTFEHLEIAAYEALKAAAAEAGDSETQRVCDEILKQEQAMASWLIDNLGGVTRRHLELEGERAAADA